VYEARVLGVPDAHDLKRLAKGVTIDDRPTQPAIVKILRTRGEGAVLEITVREGRNRQVRKMCEAIGHPVSQLTRVAIGPLRDSRLKPGQWRDLGDAEILRLRAAAARTVTHDKGPGGAGVVATSPLQRTRRTRTLSPKLKGQRQK
jgi:16S rRNA U516 pseudouridylate synthase RsuA-like enzyme